MFGQKSAPVTFNATNAAGSPLRMKPDLRGEKSLSYPVELLNDQVNRITHRVDSILSC
jgi:hypothetical protein